MVNGEKESPSPVLVCPALLVTIRASLLGDLIRTTSDDAWLLGHQAFMNRCSGALDGCGDQD